MRGRTGNHTPHSGLNTGSDTCPAVQARPALLHASGLRTPKDNCQLCNEASKFTGDLNHWAKEVNSCVSGLQQQLPDVPGAPTFIYLSNLLRGSRAVTLGTGHIYQEGLWEGSRRQVSLFVSLGKSAEQAWVLTSKLLAREVFPWQITCFCSL